MEKPIIVKTIYAKYARDERWDVFIRLWQICENEYQQKTGKLLPPENMLKALIEAGAKLAPDVTRYTLKDLVKEGLPFVKLEVFVNGDVKLSETTENV